MDIVFLNMSWYREWQGGIVNRNRCIVEELRKREEVSRIVCVDFLPFTGKMVIKTFLMKPSEALPAKVQVFQYPWAFFSEKWFVQALKTYLDAQGIVSPVLWSYNPMFVDVFAETFWKKKVFDAVDNWAVHPSYTKFKRRLEENYTRIEHHADVIYLVSQQQHVMFPHHGQVHWVPNGVDVSHFEPVLPDRERILKEVANKKPIPEDLKLAPIMGYLGTIQERVDLDLLREVILRCPQYLFLFVGPIWPSVEQEVKDKLETLPNAFFVGRVSYAQTPVWVKSFDVGIIAHKMDAFLPNTNSMKMYEYMAAGKPIVSTPGSGVEDYSTITIATNTGEFVDGLLKSLEIDRESYQQKCRDILAHCTWRTRVDEMKKYL